MSERLQEVFRKPPQGNTRLVTYIMAGDPQPEITVRRLSGLAAAGVDVLELGIPFSDPMADGPVIQAAADRALAAGMTVKKCLEIVREFRQNYDTPVLLMGYLNPVLQYGFDQFVQDATGAGVDGLILPDLPYREGRGLRELAAGLVGDKLTFIPMIAQTSQAGDVGAISGERQGFAYVLSQNGITGREVDIPGRVLEFIDSLRTRLQIPLCVGFGIQNAEQVRRLADHVDGVVVGSALVRRFHELDCQAMPDEQRQAGERDICRWVSSLKAM